MYVQGLILIVHVVVQGPDYKKPTDYVNGLFKLEITSRPRPANSPFSRSRTNTPSSSPPPSSTIHNANSTSTIRYAIVLITSQLLLTVFFIYSKVNRLRHCCVWNRLVRCQLRRLISPPPSQKHVFSPDTVKT